MCLLFSSYVDISFSFSQLQFQLHMDVLMAAAVPPTDEDFRDWLAAVKNDVGIDDFVEVVGTDLLASKVLSAADFGTPPNSLQLAKLTRRMRSSGILIADIDNDEAQIMGSGSRDLQHFAAEVGPRLSRRRDRWSGHVMSTGGLNESSRRSAQPASREG